MSRAKTKTTAQSNLFIGEIKQLRIPLPPLAEQERIVAKLYELLRVCDDLKQSLTAAQSGRARLLEAVLHEALAGNAADPERIVGTSSS